MSTAAGNRNAKPSAPLMAINGPCSASCYQNQIPPPFTGVAIECTYSGTYSVGPGHPCADSPHCTSSGVWSWDFDQSFSWAWQQVPPYPGQCGGVVTPYDPSASPIPPNSGPPDYTPSGPAEGEFWLFGCCTSCCSGATTCLTPAWGMPPEEEGGGSYLGTVTLTMSGSLSGTCSSACETSVGATSGTVTMDMVLTMWGISTQLDGDGNCQYQIYAQIDLYNYIYSEGGIWTHPFPISSGLVEVISDWMYLDDLLGEHVFGPDPGYTAGTLTVTIS